MAKRKVMVAGEPIEVQDWDTAETIMQQAGVQNPAERTLVEMKPGEPGKVMPKQQPLNLKGGEQFDHLPVGTYGAASTRPQGKEDKRCYVQ